MKQFVFFIMLLLGVNLASAKTQDKQSYNFTRALEEMENDHYGVAADFLQKEIADNPGNGLAYLYLASLQGDAEEYSDAMTSVNLAIKKLPKKDKENLARAYASRGNLYAMAGDTVQTINDFTQAIKLNPDDEDLLTDLAQYYYELRRYDEADELYRRAIVVNPMGVMGYMGLGRDAYAQGNYDDAVKQYDAVLRLHDAYSSGYAFRAETYLKQGKYLDAINDVIKALEIDSDTKALFHLFEFPADQSTLVETKLKGMAVKEPHNPEWWLYIAMLHKNQNRYAEAIGALRKAYDIDAHPAFIEMMADSYRNLGDYANALDAVNEALQMTPDDLDLISAKADILGESGDIDGAIAGWTDYIERTPDFCGGYYRRGFFEDNSGKTDAALDDYNMAIMLQPDYAYAYLGKGDILTLKGQTDEAAEAYRMVVELDTVPSNDSCAMYALLALGEKDKAIDFMNRVIENDSTYAGNYYDAACFYSRLGDLDASLANLRTAFEKGFRRFAHVMADDDLEALRQTDGFKALMDEFQTQTPEASQPQEVESVSERVEIPFTPEGGCASVKCSINDLPLNFIFDTGASIVSLSQVEANFMLKNGYLKRDDFVGSGRFVDANGDVSEGSIVNLRNVDFGGLKLTNVRASVVRNQKAPLLLGQSVLGRLGTIQIDNATKKLIITH